MRIDKLLWFLRLCKSRNAAQQLAEAGQVRLNRARVLRPAQAVKVGDVLVFPHGAAVLVIELLAVPDRRGPTAEAQACYRVLDAGAANPIAAAKDNSPEGITTP
jgi:ribosome-associated heat shock protein Hsp15